MAMHGTHVFYSAGCRCDDCKIGHTLDMRILARRRLAVNPQTRWAWNQIGLRAGLTALDDAGIEPDAALREWLMRRFPRDAPKLVK